MALMQALQDDFATNALATKWPNYYGAVTVGSGVVTVPSTTGYSNGLASAESFTLNDSFFYCRAIPAPRSGSNTVKYTEYYVADPTAGTPPEDAGSIRAGFGFNFNTSGALVLEAYRYDTYGTYTDANVGAYTVTYNATNHAWICLDARDTHLKWRVSANGTSWTTLRDDATIGGGLAKPSWMNETDLQFLLLPVHAGGSASNAQMDNFNINGTLPSVTPANTNKGAGFMLLLDA
jgi:hypothetical protein